MSHQEALGGFNAKKQSGGWTAFQRHFTHEGKLVARYRELTAAGVRHTPVAVLKDSGPIYPDGTSVPLAIKRAPSVPGGSWILFDGNEEFSASSAEIKLIDSGRILAGYAG